MTHQIPDVLKYNRKEYGINEEILEPFFKKFPEQNPNLNWGFTACYRGYVAHFEIKSNELFLTHLLPKNEDDKMLTGKDVFGTSDKYEWFSGLIRIDKYRGYYNDEDNERATYEFLEINKGNLINHWVLKHQDFLTFKQIVFEDFKKSPEYAERFSLWRNNNPGMEDSKIEETIYEHFLPYVRELNPSISAMNNHAISLNELAEEYKKLLAEGRVKRAYQGLIGFMNDLRNKLKNDYPHHYVSGELYMGQMDYTFFQFTPPASKRRKLKFIILLNHERLSFEIWLCGVNKTAQKEYWQKFRRKGWNKHYMPDDLDGVDSIVECTLNENPDFDKLNYLMADIEKASNKFIEEIEKFLG